MSENACCERPGVGRVLDLLEAGKVTPEEAVGLLKALGGGGCYCCEGDMVVNCCCGGGDCCCGKEE